MLDWLINTVNCSECLEFMKTLPNDCIDSIVTDPPYWLSFMGKKWDYDVPSQEIREECLRVLKPWGYLLAFAGTRTQHRMAVRIEDAGFEIRDMIAWVYGSWFPKSLNIGKAVDKLQGNERESVEYKYQNRIPNGRSGLGLSGNDNTQIRTQDGDTKGTSEWEGWGTALKPALEPITVARKPLWEKTVAENVLKYGTGGINIDGCRVWHNEETKTANRKQRSAGWNPDNCGFDSTNNTMASADPSGRFPANFIHDGSDEVVELFPNIKFNDIYEWWNMPNWYTDSGSASRFFYCAKASKSERNKGCEELEEKQYSHDGRETPIENAYQRNDSLAKNHHPTVKPIALMKYLVKLVTPPNWIVFDPFTWSWSTLIGAKELWYSFIWCEMSEEYIKIAEARLSAVVEEEDESSKQVSLFHS